MDKAFLLELAFWMIVLVVPLTVSVVRLQRRYRIEDAERRRRIASAESDWLERNP